MADFQQTYGLDLTAWRDALDGSSDFDGAARLAALCAQLPRDSRTARAESPALEWSDESYLLARCEYLLRCVLWALSEDGAKGTNRPRPLPTPAQVAADTEAAEATDFDYIDMVLGRTRKSAQP